MITDKNTGGPAFPHEYYDQQLGQRRIMEGMTLRDYFAAKAMQAILSSPNAPMQICEHELAKQSYEAADAMLVVREDSKRSGV